jgi:hypothetical protein
MLSVLKYWFEAVDKGKIPKEGNTLVSYKHQQYAYMYIDY